MIAAKLKLNRHKNSEMPHEEKNCIKRMKPLKQLEKIVSVWCYLKQIGPLVFLFSSLFISLSVLACMCECVCVDHKNQTEVTSNENELMFSEYYCPVSALSPAIEIFFKIIKLYKNSFSLN